MKGKARFQERKCRKQTLHKVNQDSILLNELYVDDITFGSDDDMMSQKFAKYMQNEF
jgi:hypothetical protein